MSQESSEEDRGGGTGRKTFRTDSWEEDHDWLDWGTAETMMAEDCLELLIEEEYAAWAAWETVERRIDEDWQYMYLQQRLPQRSEVG